MASSYRQSNYYTIVPDSLGNYADLGPISPGWLIGGVKVDNPTNNWYQIKETGDFIPPYTVGWTRDIRPTLASLTFVLGIVTDLFPTAGDQIVITLYEFANDSPDLTIGNDNGISAPLTVQGTVIITGPVTISGSVSIVGTVTVTGSVSITGDVNIGTVAGTVNIAGAVTISGTPNVNIASGTVSISGSVTVGTITAGNVNVNPGVFTLGGQGDAAIGVTGTAFQLSTTSIPTQVVMLKARGTNAGIVYVGKSTVTNTQSTAGNRSTTAGLQMDPGDMIVFPATNLNAIYINGTAGDGVSYEYWT